MTHTIPADSREISSSPGRKFDMGCPAQIAVVFAANQNISFDILPY